MRLAPALLAASFATLVGHAARGSPSARLVYSRTPEARMCPDEPALRKAVAARVGYDPFFPWARQTVVVRIGTEHGGFAARVEIVGEDGVARGARELSSSEPDCVEIFDAAALAISIALDAAATEEPATTEAPAPPPPPASDVPPATEPTPPPLAVPPPDVAPPPAPAPHVRRIFLGLDVLGSWGTAPSLAAGGAFFVGLRERVFSGAIELRVDGPAGATVGPGGTAPQAGVVTSWLYAASLVPCAHYGVAAFCAVGTLGSLQGSGQAAESLAKSAVFAAAGGRFGVEWGLSDMFALRAHVDLLADLAPTSLKIDAYSWNAPPVAVSAGAGVVARFP